MTLTGDRRREYSRNWIAARRLAWEQEQQCVLCGRRWLEDAMAIVHDAAWQARETLDYVNCRMQQVDGVLQIIRSDPSHYDPDSPNHKQTR